MQDFKRAEKDFEGFFAKQGKDAFVFRLTDTAAAKAMNGKAAFVAAQPSDYIVVSKGETMFCEVKSSKSPTSFPHSNIQKNQLAAARRIIKAGGTYVFFLKAYALNKWFIVPAQVIINATKKSTSWSDITSYEWTPE